jgi:peptide/nickel transport system permease protein
MRYLVQRLLQGLLLLTGVSLLSFIFIWAAPGTFYDEMRLNPQISGETLAALRAQYELDKPLPIRYFGWIRSVAKGEWGFSFAYNSPVAPLLATRARNTLLLTVPATLLAWLFALPLGIVSAEKRRGWIDRALSVIAGVLLATPDLLLALALLLLAVYTRWLPVGGMESLRTDQLSRWDQFKDVSNHLISPVLVLVLGSLPTLFRHTRAAMIDALNSPFVRAARAHGISRWRIIFRHALPVAANPLISFFGLYVGWLLSASLLVEVVMSWPGLGPLLLEAILGRDVYVVVGAVMCASAFLIMGAILSDALLLAVDPRIRGRRMA